MLDRLCHIGGEAQAPGGTVARDHLEQAGLVDRDAARLEDADLLRVQIQAQHVVAYLRQARPADQTDITGSRNCDFQVVS